MKRNRKPLTDAEREQRRVGQRELITASVEQLRTSAGWQAYLQTRRVFHNYSPRNILLIGAQHPTATRVAGFGAWIKLGYSVRKGEHAIRIWAPCPPSRAQLDAWQKAGGDPAQKPKTHWRLAAVFAQDQVSPLPPPADPAPLEAPIREIAGETHAELIEPLCELARETGYTVRFADSGRSDGYCNRTTREIVIAERLEANGRLATLIHEIAHALIPIEAGKLELSYAQEELVVESVAFSCCEAAGLDTSANSIPYLASWAEQASLEILEQTAALTGRLCSRIEDRILTNQEQDADTGTVRDQEPVAA